MYDLFRFFSFNASSSNSEISLSWSDLMATLATSISAGGSEWLHCKGLRHFKLIDLPWTICSFRQLFSLGRVNLFLDEIIYVMLDFDTPGLTNAQITFIKRKAKRIAISIVVDVVKSRIPVQRLMGIALLKSMAHSSYLDNRRRTWWDCIYVLLFFLTRCSKVFEGL